MPEFQRAPRDFEGVGRRFVGFRDSGVGIGHEGLGMRG